MLVISFYSHFSQIVKFDAYKNITMHKQTLEQLKSGELKGTTKIKLSCGLKEFPAELFQLVDTLELLDLSGNQLSMLPADLKLFKKLKIAFFSDNLFTELPAILGQCVSLQMIGFKANKISHISENAIPIHTRWLILTDNCIAQLPDSIGNCAKLQKVMLAGNKLTTLPKAMSNCKNIELLRISANNILQLPLWIFTLPRLSWLAHAANPCSNATLTNNNLNTFSWNDIALKEELGNGASGVIYKADINKKNVAVKIFKGEVTSDGLPQSEMLACEAAGNHPNITTVLGEIKNHPENKQGLVLELIADEFKNLGNPPSFETCTRDTFDSTTVFTTAELMQIISGIASALNHLHNNGIMHGDVYAHNILIDKKANPLLGDFGAATQYDNNSVTAESLQKIEVRTFGYLLEDILTRTNYEPKDEILIAELNQLLLNCTHSDVLSRPTFKTIVHQLSSLSIKSPTKVAHK